MNQCECEKKLQYLTNKLNEVLVDLQEPKLTEIQEKINKVNGGKISYERIPSENQPEQYKNGYIRILFPISNKEWSLAVFQWCIDFCDTFKNAYIVNYNNLHDFDSQYIYIHV